MNATENRRARSSALIVSLIIGAVLLAGSALSAVPRIIGYFTDLWNGRADLMTGRAPFIPLSGDSWGSSETNHVDYSGIVIVSDEALIGPRVLQATAEGLGILVVIGGGLLTVVLAIRMLRSRPFARMLSWGLGVVGVLAILAAAVAPQLNALAVDLAVNELGYSTYGDGHDGMVTETGPDAIILSLWDPLWMLDRVDATLLLLGVVIAVLGLLVADGTRLQKETEGLV